MKSNLEFDRRPGVVAGLVSRKTGRDNSRRAGDSRGASTSKLGCHVRRAVKMPAAKPSDQIQPAPSESLD